MQLTRNNARLKPPSRRVLAMLVASMATTGFLVPRSAVAIEFETTVWNKYNNATSAPSDTISTDGRIPLGTAGKGDVIGTVSSAVIKDGNTYKMWYSGRDTANWRIYYATSPDGLDWTKYSNDIPANSDTTSTAGRIPLGTAGKGDNVHVSYPAVIKDGNIYKMWYSGYDSANWRIYYATSSNGLDWTKYSNAVPANSDTTSTAGRIPRGNDGKGDDRDTYTPTVIQEDANTYKMWYSGHDGTNQRIYYATSSNGLDWTKYSNAVPTNSDTTSTAGRIPRGTSGKGDDYYVGYQTVIKDESTYKMWYSGYNSANYRIYHATSLDGLTWTKYNNTIPTNSDTTSTAGRIPIGTSGKGDDVYVYAVTVIKDGSTYKMWYGGYDGGTNRIYHARSVSPAGTFIIFH
ncbi:MAG: hypothetical protein HYV36_00455 [Lentisphaerae bacterium]|nr:hypothetical protein [Lentisphaerota bacterium]